MVGNIGGAGAARAVGQLRVVTRNYSGRQIMESDSTYTNTIGAGNSYLICLRSAATFDLGAAATTFIRLQLTTGSFVSGIIRARFT
jgi:hypothetical protein